MSELVTISKDELDRLKHKAKLYEKMVLDNSKAGKKAWSKLTPEQRSERAKKAVAARIAKYNQNVVK